MTGRLLSEFDSELAQMLGPLRGQREVTSITAHTDSVVWGSVFVCMPSSSVDTHTFIPQAVNSGACAVVVHSGEGARVAEKHGIPYWELNRSQPEFNRSVALLARSVLGDPSAAMRVIGITGTNGKTTTAWILRDALKSLGRKPGYLGTLGYDFRAWLMRVGEHHPVSS